MNGPRKTDVVHSILEEHWSLLRRQADPPALVEREKSFDFGCLWPFYPFKLPKDKEGVPKTVEVRSGVGWNTELFQTFCSSFSSCFGHQTNFDLQYASQELYVGRSPNKGNYKAVEDLNTIICSRLCKKTSWVARTYLFGRHLEVVGSTEEKIGQLAQVFFGVDSQKAYKLRTQLGSRPDVRSLMLTPLLATSICQQFDSDQCMHGITKHFDGNVPRIRGCPRHNTAVHCSRCRQTPQQHTRRTLSHMFAHLPW